MFLCMVKILIEIVQDYNLAFLLKVLQSSGLLNSQFFYAWDCIECVYPLTEISNKCVHFFYNRWLFKILNKIKCFKGNLSIKIHYKLRGNLNSSFLTNYYTAKMLLLVFEWENAWTLILNYTKLSSILTTRFVTGSSTEWGNSSIKNI